jgi:hypothetical protein
MKNWTPEAKEYLEGYLAQVRALARQSGEDADEIAEGLRDHIEREVEASEGLVVTLEVLRQTLAIVGTPEAVVSADPAWMKTKGGSAVSGETPAPQSTQRPVQYMIDQPPASLPKKKSRFGCWVLVVAAFLFALLLFCTCTELTISYKPGKRSPTLDETAVTTALREIRNAELRYVEEVKVDKDGDGVPDYGTTSELRGRELITEDYTKTVYRNFLFHLKLTPSAKTGSPSFVCEALPIHEDYDRELVIDQSGEIRILPARGMTLPGQNP